MFYQVRFSESAIKQIKKLDPPTKRLIKNWVIKNLVDTDNPKLQGKALTGRLKGVWHYRLGDYRLFAEFKDHELIVLIFEVAHRREIYRRP